MAINIDKTEVLEDDAWSIYNQAVGSSITTQRSCVGKLKDLYKKSPNNCMVVDYYALALFNLSLYESLDRVISISKVLEQIFESNPTQTVAERLGRIKYNLSNMQQANAKELKQYASEIEQLYALYPTKNLAEPLAKIWHSISISRARDRKEYEEKIIALCSDIIDPYTNTAYANVLFNSRNTIEDRENLIDSFLGGVQTLESFGYYVESEYCPDHNAALKDFRLATSSPFSQIGKTINSYLNKLKSHPNFIELKAELLTLLFYTVQLKKLLVVPRITDPICHYTKAENIKYLIKEPNLDGHLRMYNASYMNDPEEGTVLFEFLSGGNKDHTIQTSKHHNIYLSCFTSEIDQLPMWSLYGNDGKGCCLVLSPDYFDYPVSGGMVDSIMDMANNTDYNCLYRVCYLTCRSGEIEIDIFPEDPPKLIQELREIIGILEYHFLEINKLKNDKKIL